MSILMHECPGVLQGTSALPNSAVFMGSPQAALTVVILEGMLGIAEDLGRPGAPAHE